MRQLLPMTPLTGDLGVADLAVLERYADPHALMTLGAKRLTALIVKASHNHQGSTRAAEWIDAAAESLELYGSNPAVAFTDLAAEVATESGCCERSRPSSPPTPPNARPHTDTSTPPASRGQSQASRRSADRTSSP